MAEPKPISLVQVDADDYAGPTPKPYKVVGDIPGGSGYTLPAATTSTLGGVKKAAAPGTQDFAGLYAALQAAGIIA